MLQTLGFFLASKQLAEIIMPGLELAIRKYTLAQRGVIAHDTLRKPGGGMSSTTKAEVDALAVRQAARRDVLGIA